jgi:serine protease SohB
LTSLANAAQGFAIAGEPAMAKVIPVVRLEGVIAAGGSGRGLNLASLEPALKQAFAMKKAPAVALSINSPGGSPAQSSLIGKRIRQLAAEKNKPVLAFVEDVAASGGYWLACAADEVFANETSILGSIGVIYAGFGFPAAIDRLGVERRVYTAGQSKSQLDPFRPANPDEIANWQAKLTQLHQVFIDHVKAARGAKLKPHPHMFEGEIFIGAEAVRLGLADGLGDLHGVLAERYGAKTKLKLIKPAKPSLLSRLIGQSAQSLLAAAEERALWARFGL